MKIVEVGQIWKYDHITEWIVVGIDKINARALLLGYYLNKQLNLFDGEMHLIDNGFPQYSSWKFIRNKHCYRCDLNGKC